MITAPAGFETCFRQHVARLIGLAESMTGDREVARDITQETFVRLHRHWDSVSTYENVGGWLSQVLARLVIDHTRSISAERRAIDRLAARPSASFDLPAEPAGDEWARLIATLPARQRVIVTMFYAADQSIAEIADTLGVSPNTVKSALAKARATLRDREGRP